uniref:Cysteine rich secretory protein LCCL domain containing 2 n=1 Tax=Hippocampus comes TaxID=109280 RepID=A0A3Q2YLP1_HIPCM
MAFIPLLTLLLLSWLGSSTSLFLPDSQELRQLLSRYEDQEVGHNSTGQNGSGSRSRRAIRWSDREEILQLHNKLRGSVYPSAANMEYMVWDDELERSATHWAEVCQWDHGPQDLLMSIGQNLAVHWGRYRSPAFHVQAWYDEVKDYTYPYPHECNPWCPERCSGPMCTHYTQVVWATTSRVGCAVHVCPRMNVWGETWENAVYLVCNYSPKGNWIGEAPYKNGRPCSQCPPSYGGGCRNNLCYKGETMTRTETEDMNEVEKPQVPVVPRTTAKPAPKPSTPKKPVSRPSTPTQSIKCETRLRDKCKGVTCNRYKCPANCMNRKGKVWGTLYYDVVIAIKYLHHKDGNKVFQVNLKNLYHDKLIFFLCLNTHLNMFCSKYKPGNAFMMAKVQESNIDCYTTVAEICPFKKPLSHCPRVFCPSDCKSQPSYWSPVVGSNIYMDNSSICKAAIHAGVIPPDGGFVDVLPLDKRKNYVGVLKNGIQSESKSNTEGGSFRVFAVRE